MALRFIDGFDHYATADFGKKWGGVSAGSPAISAGTGRRSTASLRCPTGSSLHLTLDAQQVWLVGIAVRITAFPTTLVVLLAWLDGVTLQGDVGITNTGAVLVRGGGSATLGTSTNVLSLNTYYYLEWRLLVGNAGIGQSEVRVNGVSWLALTGVDTQGTVNATATVLKCGTVQSSAGSLDIDDLYICDGTGSAPHNTFLGDCRVDSLLPNADVTPQQWTPSTGTTHYTLVDETAPNTTDYVSSSTPTHRELFGMQDLTAATGTIYGAQLNLAALKSDAGTRSIKSLIKSGSSEILGSTIALSTSQLYTLQIQVTDPATSVAWTESGINAVNCGAEVA